MKNGMRFGIISAGITLAVVVGLMATPVWALQRTWDGGAGDNLWSSGNNWDPDGMPVADTDHVTINTNVAINLGNVTYSLVGRTVVLNRCTLTNGILRLASGGGTGGSLFATNATFINFSFGSTYYEAPQYAVFSNCDYSYPKYLTTANWFPYYNGYLKVYGGKFTCWGSSSTYNTTGQTTEFLFDGGALHMTQPLVMAQNTASSGSNILTIRNTTVRSYGSGYAVWHESGKSKLVVNLVNSTNEFRNSLWMGSNCTLRVTNALFTFTHSHAVVNYFDNNIVKAAQFDGEGLTIYMNPSTSYTDPSFRFEVAGMNQGAVFAGFHDNYSIDRLRLGLFYPTGCTNLLVLANKVNNSGSGSAEALYADVIDVVKPATIKFEGFKIYYKKLVGNLGNLNMVNGSLTQVTGAVLMAASPYVHEPEGAKRFTQNGAPVAIGSDYGTTYVSGFPVGRPIIVDLVVSGTQGNIDALRSELGGAGSGTSIQLQYAGVADGNDLFFDWNFSHRGVTLVTLSAKSILGTLIQIR